MQQIDEVPNDNSSIMAIVLLVAALGSVLVAAFFVDQKEISIAIVSIGSVLMTLIAADRMVTVAEIRRDSQSKKAVSDRYFRQLRQEVKELHNQKNAAYGERTRLAGLLAALYRDSGIGIDHAVPENKDFRKVIFINLPTGQISFHCSDRDYQYLLQLPKYKGSYDGHDKQAVLTRIHQAMLDELQKDNPVAVVGELKEPVEVDLKGYMEEILTIVKDEFIHMPTHISVPEVRLERAISRARTTMLENIE